MIKCLQLSEGVHLTTFIIDCLSFELFLWPFCLYLKANSLDVDRKRGKNDRQQSSPGGIKSGTVQLYDADQPFVYQDVAFPVIFFDRPNCSVMKNQETFKKLNHHFQ